MWTHVSSRKHTVTKVFPARFKAPEEEDSSGEVELMLFGQVDLTLKDGGKAAVPWAGHATIVKDTSGEKGEWRFAQYRVWLQKG